MTARGGRRASSAARCAIPSATTSVSRSARRPRSSASGTRRAGRSAAAAQLPLGQPAVVTTRPSGRHEARRQPVLLEPRTARSPRTIAAVLAVFAATQSRRRPDGAPGLRGGKARARVDDVVALAPAARQRRTAMLEVASAAVARWRPTGPGASGPSRWSSAMRTGQPPPGGGPATARSPPRETRAPAPVASCTSAGAPVGGEAPWRWSRGRARRPAGRGRGRAGGRARRAASRRAGTVSIGAAPSPRRRRRSRGPSRARASRGRRWGRRRRRSRPPPRARRRRRRAGAVRPRTASRRRGSTARARSRRGSGCRRGRGRGAPRSTSEAASSSASARVTVTCASTPIAGNVCVAAPRLGAPRGRGRRTAARRAARPAPGAEAVGGAVVVGVRGAVVVARDDDAARRSTWRSSGAWSSEAAAAPKAAVATTRERGQRLVRRRTVRGSSRAGWALSFRSCPHRTSGVLRAFFAPAVRALRAAGARHRHGERVGSGGRPSPPQRRLADRPVSPGLQTRQTRRPGLGLALSGGGFRASFFHVGVLARLAETGTLRKVEVISTVSGGSILGALYYLALKDLLESVPDAEIARRALRPGRAPRRASALRRASPSR